MSGLKKALSREIALFLSVGVTNTILVYIAYITLLQVFNYGWAFTGAFIVGLIYTGLLNFRVTFRHRLTVKGSIVFAAYYGSYFLLNLALLHVLVGKLGIDKHYAPLLILPVVVPIAFLMTRLIVRRFGKR